MLHSALSSRITRWSAIPLVTAGLLGAVAAPLPPALAQVNDYDYTRCAEDLLAAGLDDETIAAACALAYRPQEVSSCVVDVTDATAIAPKDALSACSRDRRPLEVATCVTGIHQDLTVADSKTVLDYCHRSLLPVRYSDCVISLAETVGLSTEESLAQCISAGYRPENVAPTYIPLE